MLAFFNICERLERERTASTIYWTSEILIFTWFIIFKPLVLLLCLQLIIRRSNQSDYLISSIVFPCSPSTFKTLSVLASIFSSVHFLIHRYFLTLEYFGLSPSFGPVACTWLPSPRPFDLFPEAYFRDFFLIVYFSLIPCKLYLLFF